MASPDQPQLHLQADSCQKQSDLDGLLLMSSRTPRHSSDQATEAREGGHIRKVTQQHQQSLPVGTGGPKPLPSISGPDMLPDHFECLNCTWIYLFFKVSKATQLTF